MRAAFLLADVHGFTMSEIATALEITEATAKTRVFRARQHMRARLSAGDDGTSAADGASAASPQRGQDSGTQRGPH